MEVIIKRAGAITGFPLLYAVLPAHVESLILCAEVRTGDGGGAVVIAITKLALSVDTRTVHLGAAPLIIIRVGNTRELCLSIEYEGEDAGTAGVRSRHCVAAGVRLCSGMSHHHKQENAELQPTFHSEIKKKCSQHLK